MHITVLGCDGSITGNRRTTCYRIDDDVLIDAGTGAGELSLEQAIAIDNVFLTHAHLDHCCLLPMLADAAGAFRAAPLTVHALPETIAALQAHMLNGQLWPDYTILPSPECPYLRFRPLQPGATVTLAGRHFTALPTRHAVPCIGYAIDNGTACWAYSGDTTLCAEFWQALNRLDNLRHLLIETTFLNANAAAAERSGHLTAQLLAAGLRALRQPVELHIVHMEAGREDDIRRELGAAVAAFDPLRPGRIFEL